MKPPQPPLTEPMQSQLPMAEVRMDLGGFITHWNESAQTVFGYSAAEAVGQNILFLAPPSADTDDLSDPDSAMPELRLGEGAPFIEVQRRTKMGEVIRIGLAMDVERGDDGMPEALVARFANLVKPLTAGQLHRLQARIVESSEQGILIVDANERIVYVNHAFCRITGFRAHEAIGRTPDLLRSGQHDEEFRSQVRAAMRGHGPWSGEIIGKRRDGTFFPQSVTIGTVRDEEGEVTHAFSIFSDISQAKDNEKRIDRLRHFDELTGLPNDALFTQLLSQQCASVLRRKLQGALLLLGLDRVTSFREGMGDEAADELMRQVAHRLRAVIRDEDTLARLRGDRLGLILPGMTRREEAARVAHKIDTALSEPIEVMGHSVRLQARLGVALFPDDGTDPTHLLRHAELARLRADSTAASYLFFNPEMNQRVSQTLSIESGLRQALAQRGLTLVYQPKASLRNGRISGAEALLRWNHPERGPIAPAEFVPVAEESGLIMDLGQWVLEEAARQIRAWLDSGLTPPPIAINVSARQFDNGLPQRVSAALQRHGLSPQALSVEITESLMVRGHDVVIPIMNDLVAHGIGIALDDFGTGYSSLAYLKRFPINTLKIDRSFVVGIPRGEHDCAIAKAIVTMAKQLRQELVAEGVESVEQMRFLRELGCDHLQGYLFSPALDAATFADWVRQGRRLTLPDDLSS
jgi:PAS domain S-box-containing protein/diguanylate cyclase (GGDEF)-like protein